MSSLIAASSALSLLRNLDATCSNEPSTLTSIVSTALGKSLSRWSICKRAFCAYAVVATQTAASRAIAMSLGMIGFIGFPPWLFVRRTLLCRRSFVRRTLLFRFAFVAGGLVNLLLGDVEFGACDAHRQHHLFLRALTFGDFGQPPPLIFAAVVNAEAGDEQDDGHRARHRPFHL